jgi:hypothetical protein
VIGIRVVCDLLHAEIGGDHSPNCTQQDRDPLLKTSRYYDFEFMELYGLCWETKRGGVNQLLLCLKNYSHLKLITEHSMIITIMQGSKQ